METLSTPPVTDFAAVKLKQQAPGPRATTLSSERRCRSSARRCARRSIYAPANVC